MLWLLMSPADKSSKPANSLFHLVPAVTPVIRSVDLHPIPNEYGELDAVLGRLGLLGTARCELGHVLLVDRPRKHLVVVALEPTAVTRDLTIRFRVGVGRRVFATANRRIDPSVPKPRAVLVSLGPLRGEERRCGALSVELLENGRMIERFWKRLPRPGARVG